MPSNTPLVSKSTLEVTFLNSTESASPPGGKVIKTRLPDKIYWAYILRLVPTAIAEVGSKRMELECKQQN